MRHRGDQRHLIPALNEVPLLFADDDEARRLLANFRASGEAARTQALTQLLNHLANATDLPGEIKADDVYNVFVYSE